MSASTELVGRGAELAAIGAALDVIAERGQVAHVVGDPGVGKTALLHAATVEAQRRGFAVLWVRGTQAESQLKFAALHRLLRPILHRADGLPDRHRRALLGAFGLVDGEATERLFVGLAALELIADAGAATPVLIAVDDLPWIDKASREAVEFVARRIEYEPALMLLSARSTALRPGETVGPLLELEGLDSSASRALLRQASPSLSADEERRVLSLAAGNPLALLELPRGSSEPRRRRTGAAVSPVALTERLEEAFTVRMDEVSRVTRQSLLLAAAQDSDRLAETEEALAALTGNRREVPDFGPAVAAGLLSTDRTAFRFRHPLVRSAIGQWASEDERREVHLAFAQSLVAEPDRATWHRSLAATGSDDQLADELDAGAERAIARGAPDVAKDWLERAAELSGDDKRRAHRLVRAAELAFELGQQTAVSELMGQARVLPLEPADYARLAGLEGAFDDGIPGDRDHILRLVRAAERARGSGEQDLAASLLLGAAMPCYWGGADEPVRSPVREGAAALELAGADPRVMVITALIDPYERGAELHDQLNRWAEEEVTDVNLASALARAAFVTGDFDRAVAFAGRAVDGLREQGRIAFLTQALVLQTFAALYLGQWDITKVASDEAYRFAVETHQPVWEACARLGQANLAGLQGDDERALSLANDVARLARAANNRALLNGAQLTRGFAALGAGRPYDAFAEFSRMMDPCDVASHSPQSAWAIDYFADAAALAGHRDEAAAVLRKQEELAHDTPAGGIVRAMTLARALLADDAEAAARFAEARRIAATAVPWYRARVDLAYGSWLQRERKVAEAGRPLTDAHAVFDALGATAWSARARDELEAAGHDARPRDPESWARLSPQELQIARLAAEGLSNRQIGEQLYLSHRTVASYLYRVFPKLGVRARSELPAALNED